jgi:hypothetical protein
MFAAMVFDAAGYYKEAEMYMTWMAKFVYTAQSSNFAYSLLMTAIMFNVIIAINWPRLEPFTRATIGSPAVPSVSSNPSLILLVPSLWAFTNTSLSSSLQTLLARY